jgi:hypothetical protein
MKLLNDHSNLRNIITELQHREADDEDSLSLLTTQVRNLQKQVELGFPFQDVLWDSESSMPVGIPVTLANMILAICEYCAEHNIDLVEGLEQAA